jgi:hypothetical protein
MGDQAWSVGDVCRVVGEGDEVFVVSVVGDGWAALFGHGEVEGLEKLRHLTEAELVAALDDLVTRVAVLQVHAGQVAAELVKRGCRA